MKLSVCFIGVAVLVLFVLTVEGKKPKKDKSKVKLGKLTCSETDGLQPDADLMELVLNKCPPKHDASPQETIGCLVKCLLQCINAVSKKTGKIKKKKALQLAKIFPDDKFDLAVKALEGCIDEHNPSLEKEPNGACKSWRPFAGCYETSFKKICPSKKDRHVTNSSTTTASPVTSSTISTLTTISTSTISSISISTTASTVSDSPESCTPIPTTASPHPHPQNDSKTQKD